MKRNILSIICIILFLSILTSCGGKTGKPDDVSEGYYQYGLSALKITDKYLAMTSSADELCDELMVHLKKAESLQDPLGSEYSHDFFVNSIVSSLYMNAWGLTFGSDSSSYDVILEKRNELAGYLNEPAFGE